MTRNYHIKRYADAAEQDHRKGLTQLLKQCPIPDTELLMNLGLFLTPQALSRILFMDFLYRQTLHTQGVVIEFGCRWGQTLALFSALRGIYEPYNRLRKIVGFDTFQGFSKISRNDGKHTAGSYSVTKDYESYLEAVLTLQEKESPLAHLKKHTLIKGDASVQFKQYLKDHPETIVSLAYFDMDLYEPTEKCLTLLKGRLTRGSVIGFDELAEESFPGETLALKKVLGLGRYAIRRHQFNARCSYIVIDS